MGNLTDRQIQHWIRQREPVARSDGDGLTFTLSKGGTASWILRFRLGGKQREKTLGRYPDISLKKAREIASENRVQVHQGVNVAHEKQVQKLESAAAWTVRQLAADYEEKVLPSLAASTGIARRQKIRDYINPAIGHLPAKLVTGADIVHLLERAAKKSPRLVKGILSLANLIFAHGLAKHIVTLNPTLAITAKAIVGAEGKNRRVRVKLSDEEIVEVLAALGNEHRVIDLIVRILLSTAVRINAIMLSEWCHIDFDRKQWLIPPDEGRKSKQEFVVPLTDQVVGYFRELREFAGASKFVCPILKRRNNKVGDYPMPAGSVNHALERVCEKLAGKVRNFSPHDLRSSARSHLGALGVPVHIAERCLNHSLGNLIDVYDQHDYFQERKAALELWSSKLIRLESAAGSAAPRSTTVSDSA